MMGIPRRFMSKIGLIIGLPLDPSKIELSAAGLQEAVAGLRGDWR